MLGIGPRSIVSRPPLWLLLSGSAAAQEVVLNGAQTLLDGETDGLAFDFTDSSAYIIDTGTPANNYNSTGIVSNGSLVGPSGKLTYTSPSNKLTMQADGYIKYQAHNLYLNSEAPANQSITVVSGASYAVTITGTVSVTASGAATGTWTAGTNTFTAATTTLTLGSTSGSGTVHVRRTPSNDDYIETAGAAKYALPLEYDTSGNCLGLLVEEQRTNLVTYSSDLSNWTLTGSLRAQIGTAGAGPDGVSGSADLVEVGSAAGTLLRGYYMGFTGTVAAHTYSVYAKDAGGGTGWITMVTYDATAGLKYTQFDLANTALGNSDAAHTASIEDVGNGWRRCTIVHTPLSTTTMRLYVVCATSGTLSSVDSTTYPQGTQWFYLWNAQVELGSFPTSPIITYGATATRAADNISIATSAFPLGASHSLFVEASSSVGNDKYAAVISDGTAGNIIQLYHSGSLSYANIVTSVSNQFVVTEATATDTLIKYAIGAATNDCNASFNGSSETLDTSATMPTITTLYVGNRNGISQTNGIVTKLVYVPRRKSDAELQAETA